MLPVVRTFISLPAGIARMNFPRFVLFTFIGAFPGAICWPMSESRWVKGGNIYGTISTNSTSSSAYVSRWPQDIFSGLIGQDEPPLIRNRDADTLQYAHRQTRTVSSIEPKRVRMYVCGVTVYDYCHIGHARSALVFDVLRRYLEYSGYEVTFVKNFTDVDDKIIKRAMNKVSPVTRLRANISMPTTRTWVSWESCRRR